MQPALCRAARELLGWTQEELAGRAGVSRVTVSDYEAFKTAPRRATLAMLARTFFDAGVEITGGVEPPGLRVLNPEILAAPPKLAVADGHGAETGKGDDNEPNEGGAE